MRPALLAAVLLLSACGGAPRSPASIVLGFSRALRDGRPDDAYALMSRAYRERVSLAEFRRQLEQSPDEARESAEALSAITGPTEELAVVPLGDGEEIRLAREGADWRITTNLVDFYDQSSPRAALRTFVRAMERERYDVVLRLVPAADREGMSPERMREAWQGEAREEVDHLIANLRGALGNEIEQVGDRATMRYGERATVQFVREGGLWKIEDPE